MLGRFSIRRHLQLLIVLTTGLALGLACAIFVYFEWQSSLALEKQAAISLSRITADASSGTLAFRGTAEAEKLLAAFRAEPNILAAALYDLEGRLFAEYYLRERDRPPRTERRTSGLERAAGYLTVYQPVFEGEKRYGTFYLRTDLRGLFARMTRYGWIAAVIFAASMASAYFVGQLLQQTISQPLLALAETARVISQEHTYHVRAQPVEGGEIGVLTAAFNQMLEEIQQQQRQVRLELTERKRAQEAESRERQLFGTTLASIGDAVIMTDAQGQITFLNREAERLTGWTNDQAIGRPLPAVFRILNEFTREPVESPVDKVLRLGTIVGLANHTILVQRDGGQIPIDDSAAPISQPLGPLLGVVLVFRDFTERKLSEEALRRSEEQIRLITDATPALISYIDADGHYRFANQQYEGWFGRPRAEVLGRHMKEIWGHEAFTILQPYRDRVTTGEEVRFEVEIPFGQETRWIDGHYLPHLDANGQFRGFFVLIIDITERKRHEAALAEQTRLLTEAQEQLRRHATDLEKAVADRTAKLSETLQELEAFSYSIAHDMRAPLRAMQGFSNLLQDEYGNRFDDEARDFLRRIGASANRLDHLIRDVLNYSKIARTEVSLEAMNAHKFILDIIHTYPNLQPPQADIQIEGSIPNVWANPAALTQVVSNLLGNAVKFVYPGVKPQVRIWAEPGSRSQEERRVRIWFQDNGIGIRPEVHERIFLMFQRINPPGHYDGTGIGLTIVRKAVERMGGRVGLQSEPGKGSRFWIELRPAPRT